MFAAGEPLLHQVLEEDLQTKVKEGPEAAI